MTAIALLFVYLASSGLCLFYEYANSKGVEYNSWVSFRDDTVL